ncbi:SitI3 family protein [Micromonospora sp. NPDC000207]|uniref:SitI3 family protein n=1 Tax=Micromonospora sp. NPDC000207 TaxID=3154246 RepID=UPI00331ACECC
MSIWYRLTLAGDIPLRQVADLAAPHACETTFPPDGGVLTSDLYDECGYLVSITSGDNGYYDAEDDDGTQWEWEPERYVDIDFDMSKDDRADGGELNVVTTVARVLAARPEDAALVLNGNWVLLTRVAGQVRQHRPQWWETYGLGHLVPH